MGNEFIASVEIALDELRTKIHALEVAVMQIPQINYQSDPSRLPGVVVEPAALAAP